MDTQIFQFQYLRDACGDMLLVLNQQRGLSASRTSCEIQRPRRLGRWSRQENQLNL